MSELSLAYIFHNQQLLVDENHKLPSVEAMTGDLKLGTGDNVIARDLKTDDQIPAGFKLVPIRQLVSTWSTDEFCRQAVRSNSLNGAAITSFVAVAGMKLNSMPLNTQ